MFYVSRNKLACEQHRSCCHAGSLNQIGKADLGNPLRAGQILAHHTFPGFVVTNMRQRLNKLEILKIYFEFRRPAGLAAGSVPRFNSGLQGLTNCFFFAQTVSQSAGFNLSYHTVTFDDEPHAHALYF